MKTATAMIAIAGIAGIAAAQTSYTGGAGFSFPDNDPFGAESSIVITDGGVIQDLNIDLSGMNHTWIGDLIITLTNETTGTSVTASNRAGQTTGGSATFGFNIDVDGDYSFDDEATNGSWDDQLASNNGSIAPGAYNSVNALSAFDGEAVAGTWTLSVSDNAGGDVGSLGGWGLTITVPAPGAIAVAGLGGLVATRRRR